MCLLDLHNGFQLRIARLFSRLATDQPEVVKHTMIIYDMWTETLKNQEDPPNHLATQLQLSPLSCYLPTDLEHSIV